MPSASEALARVESSNASPATKSYFRRMLDGGMTTARGARGMLGSLDENKARLSSGMTAVRDVAESGLSVVGLAAVDVYQPEGGLDYKGKYPIDAAVAVLGIGASILLPGHVAATTAKNVGRGAADVFLFRKSHTYFAEKKLASTGTPAAGTMAPGPASASPAAAGGAAAPGYGFGNDNLAALAADL